MWQGKEIKDLSDMELVQAHNTCVVQEHSRLEASQHEKFNKDRTINGKKILKMEFPPINENFLKLKQALETEINKRGLDK